MIPVLTVSHLTFHYCPKCPIIHDLSFQVESGQCLAFVGPSGCGKSTLLSLLAGILTPSSGTIQYQKQLCIGYMLAKNTVLEYSPSNYKINYRDGLESYMLFDSLTDTYGLFTFHSSFHSHRIAPFRTFLANADLLLLDEPVAPLDMEKRSVIMVTRDRTKATKLADQIIDLTPSKC